MNLKNIDWRKKLHPLYEFAKKVPPVLRSILGLILICFGFLGFLPFLGFWMVPLGALFIALDIPPWRKRVEQWFEGPEGQGRDEQGAATLKGDRV